MERIKSSDLKIGETGWTISWSINGGTPDDDLPVSNSSHGTFSTLIKRTGKYECDVISIEHEAGE